MSKREKRSVEYDGPPRDPAEVVRAILADPELLRQVNSALDEECHGVPGVPLRRILEEQRRRRAG